MIDTIKISKQLTSSNLRLLEKNSEISKPLTTTEGVMKECRIRNMRVVLRGNYLHMLVSLPTLMYGNNLRSLRFESVNECLQKLENIIGIGMMDARLGRIDLAQNIIVEDYCKGYFLSLIHKKGFYKQEYQSGINFITRNNTKTLSFYDKIKSSNTPFAKKRGIQIIPEFAGRNVLRYEIRLSHRLNQTLKIPHVFVKDMVDKNTYNLLIGLWLSEYLSISKSKSEIDGKALSSALELKDYLAYKGVIEYGGEGAIKNLIEHNSVEGAFQNSTQPFRMLKMVDRLFKNGYVCRENSLVKELNSKVTEAALINHC